jgi:hypothetical protein
MTKRNPFSECVTHVTGVEFLNEDSDYDVAFDSRVASTHNWFTPYNTVLEDNGLHTIFFSFENDVLSINDEMDVGDYTFNTLPNGKCIVLGIDEYGMFKCVIGGMMDGKLGILYDPDPDVSHNLTQIYEIGFFINTYMDRVDA